MTEDIFSWDHAGSRFRIPIQRKGQGLSVLMLPALSSISTLAEMAPLRDRLAERYQTVILDWPGFGTQDKPSFPWGPAALRAFLDHVLDTVAARPFATVAAGHAAAYLLDAARRRPGVAGRLVLIAPTWRGPLPTMLGRRPTLGAALATLGDVPIVGQLLYRLNVNRPMVQFMAREHVYDSGAWLSGDRLAAKMAVTCASGARHAALRFVIGELDPMGDREAFVATARGVLDPVLVVYGATSPRKSKAEMEALAALPHIDSNLLPEGKLAIHEEHPDAVFEAMMPFLRQS